MRGTNEKWKIRRREMNKMGIRMYRANGKGLKKGMDAHVWEM